MQLNASDRRALMEALKELRNGRTRRFEDVLWLRFGDDWTRIRKYLAQKGFVRYTRDPSHPAGPEADLEIAGGQLLDRLVGEVSEPPLPVGRSAMEMATTAA